MSETSALVFDDTPTFCRSETRLLEIVESACEQTDFECNRLLERIEDQVETWWFHR